MDFTTMLEHALEDIEEGVDSVEREDASYDGTSGAVLVTLDDGRKFRVSYVLA